MKHIGYIQRKQWCVPLYVMMIVGGNGENEIVRMLTADEQKDTIKKVMTFFQNN